MQKQSKKECIAMLLAGGQGSRLHKLTENIAKPAVPFGGKYRIIDFTLSNCINSGIDTVGVLTQYQPLELNEYIGNGEPWDMDRKNGGVTILPPYQGKNSADWYKGTANAIYQNINFINSYDPEYVLILSGDHIYKMDYSLMLSYHKANNADCTIAVIDVPLEEASRFGVMSTDDSGRVFHFEEKPPVPKSTKASMGIYIFNKDVLFEYLQADEIDSNSSNDFGKNIIPAMLCDKREMYAYAFDGYWKDVGTVPSLWEANMNLLGENPVFNINDRKWRVFSRNYALPPHFAGNGAVIKNSIVTEGCEIYGRVENSVLFQGVCVEEGAVIQDSVIMGNVKICKNAAVEYSIVDVGAVIGEGSAIGEKMSLENKITVVGRYENIPDGTIVNANKICEGRR